jgi:hypothetical protein
MKCRFPPSIEIDVSETFENSEPSIRSTSRGVVIILRAEEENASDLMPVSREGLQMKQMKIVSTMKNTGSEERQYRRELQHRGRGGNIEVISNLINQQ